MVPSGVFWYTAAFRDQQSNHTDRVCKRDQRAERPAGSIWDSSEDLYPVHDPNASDLYGTGYVYITGVRIPVLCADFCSWSEFPYCRYHISGHRSTGSVYNLVHSAAVPDPAQGLSAGKGYELSSPFRLSADDRCAAI